MTDTWQTLDLGGHPADVCDPPARPAFGLLYLHTLGQESIRTRPVFVAEIEARGWACVSPQGGPSFWLDRPCPVFDPVMTAERHLREWVMPLFASRWGLGPRRVAVLGVSMGGQAALRLGFLDPATFPVVASIAAAVDFHEVHGEGTALDTMFDSREAARQETASLRVQPGRVPPWIWFACDPDDAWYEGNQRLHEKLAVNGVRHTCDLETRAGGHSYRYFDTVAPAAFAFLAEGLAQESRRLL